ncbi:Lecithin:cholesterol acyltransferase-domain-containing protein [Melanogaster broomeanus]|nr:Lecithin:cholesterol acyltransferase-domain-containing protein [Melanogaster broomeanus]
MEEYDISLRIPEIDFSRVEVEWDRLRSNIPEVWKLNNDGREFQVGEAMKERGLTAQYPVVLVPGIISTVRIRIVVNFPEYRPFFREKLWGGFNMLSQVTFNRERWLAAMMLDPDTGLDPPGAKIRAAEGIDAASSFMKGYWIWAKIIENLAAVNYDTNNLHLAPYDWRLSMWNLEERDGYFSRLKATIEGFKKRHGKRVVVAAHSMGGTVRPTFYNVDQLTFKWVESPEHGGGGPDWVENHIESFISIAGTHLAKAMTALLSGEMRDTVQMNPAGAYVLERFFSRKERQSLFRSWAGSASMWVKVLPLSIDHGGNSVWGNGTLAPDDEAGKRLAALGAGAAEQLTNMTAETAGTWILERTPTSFQKMLGTNYSFGMIFDHTKWTNPLEMRLPNAPSTRFICVYGHGKETEARVIVTYAHTPHGSEEYLVEAENDMCTDPDANTCDPSRRPSHYSSASWIDADYTDETLTHNALPQQVRNGVRMGEGDGTVSLLSLGAMCVEGWKRPRWNPGRINITTVELPHRPMPNIPRGGANTSDHVDILGSTGVNELVLKVATGVGHEIEDSFVSRIREYARRVQWD